MMIMNTDFLNSLPLSETVVVDILQRLEAIRVNQAKSIRLRVANGQHLLALKKLIGHGDWIDWLVNQAAVGYHSARTVQRDMALAESLGDQLDGYTDAQLASSTNLTALRTLARDPNGDALSTCLALLQHGTKVKPAQAAQLASIAAVDTRLLDSVEAGRLTIADAASVADRIQQTNPAPEVVDVVIAGGVRVAALVDGLDALRAWKPEAFAEVAATGTIHSVVTDIAVPLAQASSADMASAIRTEEAESEARRLQYLLAWRDGKPGRLADLIGRRGDLLTQLAQLLPDDGREYHAYVYPQGEADPQPEAALP